MNPAKMILYIPQKEKERDCKKGEQRSSARRSSVQVLEMLTSVLFFFLQLLLFACPTVKCAAEYTLQIYISIYLYIGI